MNRRDMEQALRDALHHAPGREASSSELAAALALKGKDRKRFARTLARLVARGVLIQAVSQRYRLAPTPPRIEGRLQWLRSGKGRVEGPETGSVVVPVSRLRGARPGDLVAVRVRHARPGSKAAARGETVGAVETVLEHGRPDIVGSLRRQRATWRFIPLNPRYGPEGAVANPGHGRDGDRVVARRSEQDDGVNDPLYDLVENMGAADRPFADTESVMRQFGLRAEFPGAALADAEQTAERWIAAADTCFRNRLDLRDVCVFTIDPEDARDFDDAVSLTERPDGLRELGVHIADVASFVTPGGPMDIEARRRGTSVYFPDRVLPMLPERLSNGLCSLRPREDRPALSVFMLFDRQGRPTGRRFARSVIRSAARLTYEQAQSVLDGRADGCEPALPETVTASLRRLHALAQDLAACRRERHALDFDLPEPRIRVDENGFVKDIRMQVGDAAHALIEECMVAANEAVAMELRAAGALALSRYHEPPDPPKLTKLRERLEAMGYAPGNLSHPARLSAFLSNLRGDPLENHLRALALRSMKRAFYSALHHGHFGLAKDQYVHFTSPIRRYPDLTVHRTLAACLWPEAKTEGAGEGTPAAAEELARHLSAAERVADEAARDLNELLLFRHLLEEARQRSPQARSAVVVAVRGRRCFAELQDLPLQGEVRIDARADSRDSFRGKDRRGRRAGRRMANGRPLRPGSVLRVTVAGVDVDRRQILFRPAPS